MSRALPKPPGHLIEQSEEHSQAQSAPQFLLEREFLEKSFQKWINVGFEEDDDLSWLTAWEKESCYDDGDTIRLVGSQRSALSDKTVTLVRLTDYWRRSVEKLVIQKQSLMRWLEGSKW